MALPPPDATQPPVPAAALDQWPAGLRYGLLGLPLAFVALPLYVLLPHHYAQNFGVPLAVLGAVLLAARGLDAAIDPLLGRWIDRLFARSVRAVQWVGAGAAVVMAVGLAGLFFPLVGSNTQALALWAFGALTLTCAAYSLLSIAHQAWGARLGGNAWQRSRVVAWREGAGLVGVVLAAVLPGWAGLPLMLGVFAGALALGCLAWALAPRPTALGHGAAAGAMWLPWRRSAFRRLLVVFVLNGIASAIPATLVLFFLQDRLQVDAAQQPVYLGTYFIAAALGLPLWLLAVRRWGLVPAWLLGMVLSVAVFAWAAGLGAGDTAAYGLVCALSGLALGTDLALPGALLAGVIAAAGDRDRHEGAYFGWWALATKLNLALAAGLALPLLQWWGYQPGAPTESGLQALGWAYAVLPCGLKLLAALALWRWRGQLSCQGVL